MDSQVCCPLVFLKTKQKLLSPMNQYCFIYCSRRYYINMSYYYINKFLNYLGTEVISFPYVSKRFWTEEQWCCIWLPLCLWNTQGVIHLPGFLHVKQFSLVRWVCHASFFSHTQMLLPTMNYTADHLTIPTSMTFQWMYMI